MTPERKPRRFVSRALPNATHTHTDGFARACATAGVLHTSNTRRQPRPGETVTRTRNAGRWSAQEHARFVDGLEKYGRRKWIRIAEHVGTRTVIQVRSHAQKYFKKLRRAAQPPPARKVSSDDEVSLARAAAVPNLDARPQLALLTAAAKLLDGVAERPAARAPIEMERKRARSDDSGVCM